MRLAILLAVSVALGGCASVENLRPDMEARPLPSRADEIAYINGLRAAYVITSAAPGVTCYTGKDLRAFRPKYTQGYLEYDKEQDSAGAQCVSFRILDELPDEAKKQEITRYLENGFGLTDLYCQRFFIIAGETRQRRHLQRDLGATADPLVIAVLKALSASASALTVVNAGFGAYDGIYKNIDDAFLITPERDTLRKLVLSAQQEFRSQAFSDVGRPNSYPGARSVIERYAGLCSFDGMKQLVADTLEGGATDLNKAAAEQAKKNAGDSGESGGETAPAKPKPPAPAPEEEKPEGAVPVPITSPE